MKYALTGANGYIGSRTARTLLAAGQELLLIVRAGSSYPRLQQVLNNYSSEQYQVFEYDGTSDSLVLPLEEADRVIHLAALYKTAADTVTVEELLESNIKFSLNIFSVLAQYNRSAPVVTTSTFSSFAEDGSYAPATVYAATKSAIETLAPAFPLNVTFLRLSDTYGPADWRTKVHNLIRDALLAGEAFEMRSPRHQTINLTHVDDVIAAFFASFELPSSLHGETRFFDLYYSDNQVTLAELVELMRSALPRGVVNFPLVGALSPTPQQRLVLPGFTPSYNVKQDFTTTVFGDSK